LLAYVYVTPLDASGMQQVTVGIFHDDNLASDLGKKATESDIVLFHRKTDDHLFTFVYPVDGKIIPKSQIMNMIDIAIISAKEITPSLGETILMLDSLGLEKGIIIPSYSNLSQLEKMIENTTIESFHRMERNVHQIMDYLQNQTIQKNIQGSVAVTIDHAFHVKGVGEVVLGFVNQGIINKHDKLTLFPSDKQLIIRSIQIQDKDLDSAPAGSRVGLAIKGVNASDLNRGFILSNTENTKATSTCSLSFKKNPFYSQISKGKFHMTIGLQTVPMMISTINDSVITIQTEKPVSYLPNQPVLLLDLNANKLHHMGTGFIQ